MLKKERIAHQWGISFHRTIEGVY